MDIDKLMNESMQPRGNIDLVLWREFQEGLTTLLDIPIQLYDATGVLLVPPSKESEVCKALGAFKETAALCKQHCSNAVAQAVAKKQIHIYKCHANQHVFAVPVFPNGNAAFVIVGKVSSEGDGLKDLYYAVSLLGLEEGAVKRLKEGIRIVPTKSVFTLPGIVNDIAVPFLKCLYPRNVPAKNGGDSSMKWLKGFNSLEQVYKSIAPLFDKDEIYNTILSKCMEHVGAERGSLMLLDSQNNVLSIKVSKGLNGEILAGVKIKYGEGIAGSVAASGESVIVADIENEVPKHRNMPWYKTKSFISIPLSLDNRVIGVINISDKVTGEVFSKEDLALLRSISNYASIVLEKGEYYSMSEELKLLSMTDALTGLFNRRYFLERLFEEVERVKRHGEQLTMFLLDIDNFKAFNDLYGHSAGDEILKLVSKTIRDAVRSMDVVARYGGEEFVALLPHTAKKDSLVIAERIRHGVEEFKSAKSVFKEAPTVSIGIAEFPADAETIEGLIENADKAMYDAKRMGKNRVVVYKR